MADETTPVAEPTPVDEPQNSETVGPAPKKKGNKLKIVGIVVGVIVVLAVAFFVWHDTPGFCNAICHDPMDPYVESFSSGDESMMVVVHANNNVRCLGCHEAKLTEQVSEVMAWVSDDFVTDANGKIVPAKNFASEEFCLRSGCHDASTLVESTRGFLGNDEQYNPHSSHQDYALDCGDCHKAHEQSVLVCNECHALNAPEGWEA